MNETEKREYLSKRIFVLPGKHDWPVGYTGRVAKVLEKGEELTANKLKAFFGLCEGMEKFDELLGRPMEQTLLVVETPIGCQPRCVFLALPEESDIPYRVVENKVERPWEE
jgi:hypothetical protein